MSEFREILPGKWMLDCVDYSRGGCQGAPFSTQDGGLICELHARARRLIQETPPAPPEDVPPEPATPESPPETPPAASSPGGEP